MTLRMSQTVRDLAEAYESATDTHFTPDMMRTLLLSEIAPMFTDDAEPVTMLRAWPDLQVREYESGHEFTRVTLALTPELIIEYKDEWGNVSVKRAA